MDFLNSSDGIINGGRSNAWSMTLGASNSLSFVNFDPGSLLTLKLVQDASGSRTVSFPPGVIWQAGQAPSLQTAANAVDVFTLLYDGTNWRDTGGSASRLPGRIASAGLGTIIGAGVVALTLISSNGNGGRAGNLAQPDVVQFKTGTGASQQTVGKVTASGSFVAGQSGSLAIGSVTLSDRGTDAKFFVNPAGGVVTKSTLSGAGTWTYTKPGIGVTTATVRKIPCYKTGGDIGTLTVSATGGIATGACL